MPQPQNRLVTRGMGPPRASYGRSSMVVHGGGGFFRQVIEATKDIARRAIRLGQSGTKRALQGLEEIIVSARLLRVNDEKPSAPVSGFVRVKLDSGRAHAVKFLGRVSSKTKEALDGIKITVNRIK